VLHPNGKYRVEWVEKSADDDEQLVPFRKDDGNGTAISGKKQSKDSLKRAKKAGRTG
jgi:hypothetical protein